MRGNTYVYNMFWNNVSSDATNTMKITDKALAMLKQRVASSNTWGARLKVSGGGCGGYTYELTYAETPELITDIVYQDILVIDIYSKEYLRDAELDWQINGLNEEFVIKNNQESGRCGCGESFYI